MNSSILSFVLVSGIFLTGLNILPSRLQEKAPVVANMEDPGLADKLESAVENRLLAPLRKKDHNRPRMFSRCPSGYDMNFAETDYTDGQLEIKPSQDGLYYGKILYYNSCDGNEICEYRVNGETLVVEARHSLADEFIPARQWLETYNNDKGGAL
ncbi:MAG: hypothetical protein K1X92_00575 [Bacteroidia bacterium]|nr:hypothetical protein [Bacteroidia bacterium]